MKMKRIATIMAVATAAVLVLTGCGTNSAASSNLSASSVEVINLTDQKALDTLCDASATEVLDIVQPMADAKAPGIRNQLKAWGIKDPSDKKAVQKALDALKERQDTPCTDLTTGDKVGVVNADGTTGSVLALTGKPGEVSIIDTTKNKQTPPLINGESSALLGGERYKVQAVTWADVVTSVGENQWYKDGVNSYAAQTGFTWDDVLKFASVNKLADDGKIMNSSLVIQIINSDMTNEEALASLPKEFKDQMEKLVDGGVNALPIQRLDQGMMNTRNVGTESKPVMGEFLDKTEQVRITLMPISFDKEFCNGEEMCLDGSRGAGIFIDCLNLHWVPKAVWTCTDDSCTIPPCPEGWTGSQPNCVPPPQTCPPGQVGTPPDCLELKDWSLNVSNSGWTPMQVGPLTDGKESQRQKDAGDTSGNVIDNKVPEGTKSDDVTPDLPKDTTTVPGGNEGGDDQEESIVDEENTNQDDGGTNGDVCVPDGVVVLTCP